MMTLDDIQNRFEVATEKEHWEKLKLLLLSEDKENVVMGMSLLETLDEEVYYDGICTFLEEDEHANWILKKDLPTRNKKILQLEIVQLAGQNTDCQLNEALANGLLQYMFVSACGRIGFQEIHTSSQERLLSISSEMVDIERDGQGYLMMKYEVSQALWERVTGRNPSERIGASLPVDNVSWLDGVIFANKWSEREGLEKVYELPEGMEEGCRNQTSNRGKGIERHVPFIEVHKNANGYRLPTEEEWEYAAKGGENYKYAGSDNLDEIAWHEANSKGNAHPIGQKKCNGYGLYDMSGNLWEWCFETSETPHHICRGGNFLGSAFVNSIVYRCREHASYRGVIGIRLVRYDF